MSLKYTDNEAEENQDPHEQTVVAISPFPLYTAILIGCIIAVFIVQFLTSKDPAFVSVDRYSSFFAGFDKQAFLQNHEYWRILTGATVHSGVLHVGMNCYAFYSFGKLFEMLSNRAHLAIVFVLSAIGGGLLSLVFNPDIPSVGASGGIVGLLGYLAVYAFQRRQFISPEFRKSLLVNIGFILVFGLVLYQSIDNFGHIGGLLTGAVYGFLQIPTDEYADPRVVGGIAKTLGFAALGLYICTSFLTMYLLFTGH
ncbi:MAG TPA: rhomboid family intramembrane serine protease [Pyrinomonadaceae bacterium]|nr:rhomboid family intramembrane serine protease [Pyrinomonadaceae bacterium]